MKRLHYKMIETAGTFKKLNPATLHIGQQGSRDKKQ